ncbi:hypothetical protein [Hazenella coriacea]|uniref:Uncharacterized protein n=1 Tax=Hazenella coriacea TaxID=1179467 RepID=A0A4R3KZV5_9BACL|nr:hypothetical protein [Hazenella coriacea]TCS92353.1 hypothetical protein EDD58_11314 [Hazenella coriacea]
MSRFIKPLLQLILGLSIATAAWILFVFLQWFNYSEPDQVYLVGAIISYGFVYLFLCGVVFFIFTFIKHRKKPDVLKKRFFIFSAFYLLLSPLVIMSFDNYLLVTPKGIAYNQFLKIKDEKVKGWSEIDRVVLDYQQSTWLPNEQIRLQYIIKFKDGTTIDLNNYNSPLFEAKEFMGIHRVMVNHGVLIEKKRPLPKHLEKPDTFIYQIFHYKAKNTQD